MERVQDQLEAAKPGPLVDEVVGIYSHLFRPIILHCYAGPSACNTLLVPHV